MSGVLAGAREQRVGAGRRRRAGRGSFTQNLARTPFHTSIDSDDRQNFHLVLNQKLSVPLLWIAMPATGSQLTATRSQMEEEKRNFRENIRSLYATIGKAPAHPPAKSGLGDTPSPSTPVRDVLVPLPTVTLPPQPQPTAEAAALDAELYTLRAERRSAMDELAHERTTCTRLERQLGDMAAKNTRMAAEMGTHESEAQRALAGRLRAEEEARTAASARDEALAQVVAAQAETASSRQLAEHVLAPNR